MFKGVARQSSTGIRMFFRLGEQGVRNGYKRLRLTDGFILCRSDPDTYQSRFFGRLVGCKLGTCFVQVSCAFEYAPINDQVFLNRVAVTVSGNRMQFTGFTDGQRAGAWRNTHAMQRAGIFKKLLLPGIGFGIAVRDG